jgi:hypothetical protein
VLNFAPASAPFVSRRSTAYSQLQQNVTIVDGSHSGNTFDHALHGHTHIVHQFGVLAPYDSATPRQAGPSQRRSRFELQKRMEQLLSRNRVSVLLFTGRRSASVVSLLAEVPLWKYRAASVTVRTRRKFVADKLRRSNRLTAHIKMYFPQVLNWFNDRWP